MLMKAFLKFADLHSRKRGARLLALRWRTILVGMTDATGGQRVVAAREGEGDCGGGWTRWVGLDVTSKGACKIIDNTV